ncbi:phosphoribosylformylglycinamidine synthase I [Candidatus Pacearchaeota archaeon]|nr:phosphoribosylformylglycinamidine synthase I [Candidatus Pacearchaeota archaeon]
MKPRILVLSGYGINCERETKHAFDLAGGNTEIVHVNDLINKEKNLNDYQILAFPGGFSYGDDTGSGNAMANKIRLNLWDELMKFINSGKLIIGICNGFQVLINLGLLPSLNKDYGKRQAALTFNNSTKYECRWVYLKNNNTKCVFTKGLDKLYIPVAHGEGKFFASEYILEELEKNDQIVFTYTFPNGESSKGEFPFNPNGSLKDIAGICDDSGRILGMMPHPERAILSASSPDFQKMKEKLKRQKKDIPVYYNHALNIFKNAIDYIKENNQFSEELSYDTTEVDADENHLANDIIKKIVPFTFDDRVVGSKDLFSYRFNKTKGNFIGQKIISISNGDCLEEDIRRAIEEIKIKGWTPIFATNYIAFGKLKATNAVKIVLKIIENLRGDDGKFIPLIEGEIAGMPELINEKDSEIILVIMYQADIGGEGLIDLSNAQGNILTTPIDSVGTETKLSLQLNLMDNLLIEPSWIKI